MLGIDPGFWSGRRVFLTGQTGFKGSWLALWLQKMGANVRGRALPVASTPALFDLLGLEATLAHYGDVADAAGVDEDMAGAEVVLHLAAQALVRPSYDDPLGTFATNVMGTAAVLDAARRSDSVRAVVIVTSDKAYENREWDRGYREDDALGGHDPYSASKGAAEIVTASMRKSFFGPGGHPARVASVRAGNVIGGGDWSADRLVPDVVRGCLGESGQVEIRNPAAVRPWQHVLEPVAAYLGLAERLHAGEALDEPFNFGPEEDGRPVSQVADALIAALGGGRIESAPQAAQPHEATLLRLDTTKARDRLGWAPRLSFDETVAWTADWYRAHAAGADMRDFTARQIDEFESRAR
jgi:CDP-glucose 4,6-dehydratase